MKAFLVRSIKFTKGNLHYTARAGTPVHVLESKDQTALILFKFFIRWVNQRSIKLK